jgi:hypothetical protein
VTSLILPFVERQDLAQLADNKGHSTSTLILH